MSDLLPLCECQCGRRVKKRFVMRRGENVPVRFYNKDCVERAKGNRRRDLFADIRATLKGRITQSDLDGALWAAYLRGVRDERTGGVPRGRDGRRVAA